MKVCTACNESKDESDFHKRPDNDLPRNECKPCARVRMKNNDYKRKYGISYADFKYIIVTQDGKCKLCGVELTQEGTKGGKQRPVLDHCHSVGHVRGVLCHCCNLGLGHFHDDIEKLKQAINYLETN